MQTTLRGPDDPEMFRTKVYGTRWYHDPLPSCEVAEATDDKWPAMSTIKKAWGGVFKKRWVDGQVYDLDPLRVALFVEERFESLAMMEPHQRVPLVATAAQRDLDRAADRGTGVHSIIEALCADIEPDLAATGSVEYADICRQLVSDLNPILDFAEVVMIRRGGWGGTIDAILQVDGKRYIVDWKSRGPQSPHGAWETEVAQVGGYSLADYLVVADEDGAAKRAKMPHLDGLMIISIKPDSYECFPVDIEKAQEAALSLHETWAAKRRGEKAARASRGKARAPVSMRYDKLSWTQDPEEVK